MAIDQENGVEENRNEDIPNELPDNRKTRGGHFWIYIIILIEESLLSFK